MSLGLVAGTLAAVGTLGNVIDVFAKATDRISEASSLANIEYSDGELALLSSRGKLTTINEKFIIEPMVLISDNLQMESVTEKVAQLGISIFTSHWLQAFNVVTKVYGISPLVTFNVLSDKLTTENILGAGIRRSVGSRLSQEERRILDLRDGKTLITSQEDKDVEYNRNIQLSQEARGRLTSGSTNIGHATSDVNAKATDDKDSHVSALVIKEIEVSFELTTDRGTHTVVVPIKIRANIVYSPFRQISNLLEMNSDKMRREYRWMEYKTGGISLYNFVFADDLIKQYEERRIIDKTDLMKFLRERTNIATSKLATDGAIGFSGYYSIVIVNNHEVKLLERELGGSLRDYKKKEKLLEQMKALMIMDVNNDYDKVIVHTLGLKGTSNISFKALERGKKDAGLEDIMKAMLTHKQQIL